MSLHSDFFPAGTAGDDLIPGDVIDTPSNYIADGVNYIDITDGVTIDKSLFPDLDANLFVGDFANIALQQTMTNPNPNNYEEYGYSVSIDGDTLAVGSRYDLNGGQGGVYIFTRSGTTWTQEQRIANPITVNDDEFGTAVSIEGDTLIVGAPGVSAVNSTNGNTYVYTRTGTTWTLQYTFTGTTDRNYFGRAVELYGDYFVVGAWADDTGASTAGSIYVYKRTGGVWAREQEINNPTPVASDYMGYSVSIFGDTIVTGAYSEDTGASGAGSAYVYRRAGTTWTLEQEINHPVPNTLARFGWDVGIYGDTLVISAPWTDTTGADDGVVYVYTRIGNTWTLEQALLENSYSTYGRSVAIYGDIIAVGHPDNYTTSQGWGSVFVYKRTGTTWSLVKEIDNPFGSIDDWFGSSVDIYENNLAIGATFDGNLDTGEAYVYVAPDSNTFYIQGQDKVLVVK